MSSSEERRGGRAHPLSVLLMILLISIATSPLGARELVATELPPTPWGELRAASVDPAGRFVGRWDAVDPDSGDRVNGLARLGTDDRWTTASVTIRQVYEQRPNFVRSGYVTRFLVSPTGQLFVDYTSAETQLITAGFYSTGEYTTLRAESGEEIWSQSFTLSNQQFVSTRDHRWTNWQRPGRAPLRIRNVITTFPPVPLPMVSDPWIDDLEEQSSVRIDNALSLLAGPQWMREDPVLVGEWTDGLRRVTHSAGAFTSETITIPTEPTLLQSVAARTSETLVVYTEGMDWRVSSVESGTSRTVSLGAAVPAVVYTGFDAEGRLMLAGTARTGNTEGVSLAAEQADGSFARWDYTLSATRFPRFLVATQYWERPAVVVELSNPRVLVCLFRENGGWRSAPIRSPYRSTDFSSVAIGENGAGELHAVFRAADALTGESGFYSVLVESTGGVGESTWRVE